MSVPVEHIKPGRYYRTAFGKRPAVVKAVTGVLAHTGRVGVIDQSEGTLRYVQASRLFNEVVRSAADGRWVIFDRARHERKAVERD